MRLPRWCSGKSVRTGLSWVEWFIFQVGGVGLWLLRLHRALCWKFHGQYLSPWTYAELTITSLFCEPVTCLHFGHYSLFRWKLSFLCRCPFKTSETSSDRRVEAEQDQERCWCHLGPPRAKSNTPSTVYSAWRSSGLTGYFLRLPTSHGSVVSLWVSNDIQFLWFLCLSPF